MRLVIDVLFLEELEFKIPMVSVRRCRATFAQEDTLKLMMEEVGLELIEYGSFTVQPSMPPRRREHTEAWDQIRVFSKAFRERLERAPLRL